MIRLAGALLLEQNDEWLVQRRYLSAESMALVLAAPDTENDLASKPSRRSPALPSDPTRPARTRVSPLRLALRARPRVNPRGNPTPEVIPLSKA